MSDIAIRVDNLSKAYRIGLKEQRHETMLGAMAAWVKSPLTNYRNLRNLSRFDDATTRPTSDVRPPTCASATVPQLSGFSPQPSSDVFWALRNVSFEVKHGEVLGIIGRNGAGKSTLLKILSRITEPTSGRAEIYGRVGSLLEVGTGFHPDLTGRENVYLNGTILGMSKREVDAKFDDIVEFAEVEKFIDTPVKRYSSGMRVRLAFSVAAHLQAEILIIDEVLAVGDLRFQRKCLGAMEAAARSGRTVLFVSHNLGSVKELCTRALVLQAGVLAFDGPTLQGLNFYTQTLRDEPSQLRTCGGNQRSYLRVNSLQTDPSGQIANNQDLVVTAELDTPEALLQGRFYCIIDGPDGEPVVHTFHDSQLCGSTGQPLRLQLRMPRMWLAPDAYTLHLKLVSRTASGKELRLISERVLLDIKDSTGQMDGRVRARIIPNAIWEIGTNN